MLILDEPTNDLDTDMLAAIEDLLDTFPGTLLVVSHDRYLVERVTDQQYAVMNGSLRHLPRGVDQYLELRAEQDKAASGSPAAATKAAPKLGGAELRNDPEGVRGGRSQAREATRRRSPSCTKSSPRTTRATTSGSARSRSSCRPSRRPSPSSSCAGWSLRSCSASCSRGRCWTIEAMSHDHGGTAGHSHGARSSRTRLALALAITSVVLVAEVIGAIITGSLALLVDAAHMLTDAGGLTIALLAATLAGRPATPKRTWGFARSEVLGATAQAAVLLAVGIFVVVEAVQRLFNPPEIQGDLLVIFGVIGLLGNVASIVILASERGKNLNMRAAFLEVINDALGSVAVIVAAIVITLTGFQFADAIAAILIGALIVPRAVLLLRDSTSVLLESTPKGVDLAAVRRHLLELEHVTGVHDLHVSQIATGLPVLTAHVVVEDACFHDGHTPAMLRSLQQCVAEHFDVQIEHSTFQLEPAAHGAHEHPTHD